MAEVVSMPLMSDTMEEGTIAAWHKQVGDQVSSGDLLAEIETDKATMDFESPEEGVLLFIGAKEGETIPVNAVLAVIGEAGEDAEAAIAAAGGGAAAPAPAAEAPAAEAAAPAPAAAAAPAAEAIDTSGINAEVVTMPLMSDTMEEGTIASWHKKVGDAVESGELLAEIETDKATMDFESPVDGTLLYVGAEAGNSIKVQSVLAIIGEAGADYETLLKAQAAGGSAPAAPAAESAPAAAPAPAPAAAPAAPKAAPVAEMATKPAPAPVTTNGRVKASPLAKKMAEEKGFNLATIPGSGENGRIVKRDVEAFVPTPTAAPAAAAAAPAAVGEERYTETKVSQMRKAIARRLSESKFSAPHFYLTMDIDMDKAVEARKSMNEVAPVKISFNDMVIKAAAAALRQHPGVNSSWLGDTIRVNEHVHIGVAVAVDEGLLVPVVRFADSKPLSSISTEVRALAKKAVEKKLQPAEWEGNTFTISNLGMFGIEEFTAIVNPPDACIMAVGAIRDEAVVKNGQIVPGKRMKVTLSCDHRVVDGAVGSAFLQTFKSLLEDPVRILI